MESTKQRLGGLKTGKEFTRGTMFVVQTSQFPAKLPGDQKELFHRLPRFSNKMGISPISDPFFVVINDGGSCKSIQLWGGNQTKKPFSEPPSLICTFYLPLS